MIKRKTKKPPTKTETAKDFFPALPADDPIYKQDWIVGQTFRGSSPKEWRDKQVAVAGRQSGKRNLPGVQVGVQTRRRRSVS